jgi:hypothetical protein
MQTSIEGSNERRRSASPRIPVDLLVELCAAEERPRGARSDRMLDSWSEVSDAFADSYEADGLDLSARGLRLRSAVLPDVGQRLKCRFDLPELESRCEAEGEVVWSNDAGRHGEFGLRFDGLSPDVDTALARWAMDRGPTTLPGDEPSTTPARRGRSFARVRLDGVASAVEAEISLRDELRLEVEQALPFLELGKVASVEADGTMERRRLEHVSLRIENGIPRLVLGLVAEVSSAGSLAAPTDATAGATASARSADATVQDEELDTLLARADRDEEEAETREARESSAGAEGAWVTDGAPSSEELEAEEPSARSSGEVAREARTSRTSARPAKRELFGAEESIGDEDPRVQARRRKKLDEVRRVLLDGEELPEVPGASADAAPEPAASALAPLQARLRSARAAIAPTAVRLTTALRAGWAAFVAGAGPRARSAYASLAGWIARVASTLGERIRARAPQLGALLTRGAAKEKRRTTAAPPAAVAREATPRRTTRGPGVAVEPAPAPARPRFPLRYALVGIVAVLAVGSLAYALGSGPAEAAPIEVPAVEVPAADVEPATAAPVEPAAEPAPAADIEVGAVLALAAEPTPAAPAGEPSALAAASTEEGRLPMPGYPSIGRGTPSSGTAAPASAPVTGAIAAATSPEAAPVPAPAISTGRAFGAERVERGHTTSLRLSLPPSGLEGQADASGFTVTVRGALSLDRAAAIARSNPAVDRASILNRGDHAVLDVRFVEGRSPAYRVELRDQQLDVTIGR